MEYPCPFVRKKNLDQLYTLHTKIWINYIHICLMNHLKTHQTNLMAPGDPLDVHLGPLDLPPIDPPMTPKQVSWPH